MSRLNYVMLAILIVVQVIQNIVALILHCGNLLVFIGVQGAMKKDANHDAKDEVFNDGLLIGVHVLDFLQPVVVALYLFFTRTLWNTRIVKTFDWIEVWFKITAASIIVMCVTSMSLANVFVSRAEDGVIDHQRGLAICAGLYFIYLLSIVTFLFYYYVQLRTSINCMIEFHKYLKGYRHTPRSRNLRRYEAPSGVILEEATMYE